MDSCLNVLQRILEENPDAMKRFRRIYEPTVVGIPPENARNGLCVMPDGEIRHYGAGEQTHFRDPGVPVYLSSRDCGLHWELRYCQGEDVRGSVQSPYENRRVAFHDRTVFIREEGKIRSRTLSKDEFPYEGLCTDDFLPVFLQGRNRMLITGQTLFQNRSTPFLLISDDGGEHFRSVTLPKPPVYEEITYPDIGTRWRDPGVEPVLAELPDGRLMLLLRSAQDAFYVSYSEDDGESWSSCEPSVFYGTATTPYLYRLSDGRMLCTWCNTQSLPERNPALSVPDPGVYCTSGGGEMAFTNRDAVHAAVSEDGKHWKGFREIFLNPIRNAADFRVKGGCRTGADKSVHQSQALELPFNKVLLSVGQHEACRRLLLFDLDWLYETSRTEDFLEGLEHISTHTYVKSIDGSHIREGKTGGHCAWNRTDGPLLVPDPTGDYREALQFCRIRDPRLLSEVQGAAWNFPAARSGSLSLTLRIVGAGLRISLVDRWFNPIDTAVRDFAPVSFALTREAIPDGEQHVIRISWDLGERFSPGMYAYVSVDGKKLFRVPVRFDAPFGFSYVHMHSVAETPDAEGTYLSRIEMRANES